MITAANMFFEMPHRLAQMGCHFVQNRKCRISVHAKFGKPMPVCTQEEQPKYNFVVGVGNQTLKNGDGALGNGILLTQSPNIKIGDSEILPGEYPQSLWQPFVSTPRYLAEIYELYLCRRSEPADI